MKLLRNYDTLSLSNEVYQFNKALFFLRSVSNFYFVLPKYKCSISSAFANVNKFSCVFTKYCVFVKGGQKMYEVFEHLLQSYGISAYKFCKDTGISQSTISTWKKKNNLISGELAKKIADYFNVSIEYLMTGEEKDRGEKYYLNDDTAEIAQAVFENKDLRVLFDAAKDASPEDLKTTYDMLMALKKKERGENEF